MYGENGISLGYSNVDDKESIRAVHAAVHNGINVFDTAAAYGAGHSERLLASALKGNSDALIVTKIGIPIDEQSKQLSFDEISPGDVIPAIERCLERLQRDCIDVVLLHQNELAPEKAVLLFDEMEKAVQSGKIKAYGWSTDLTESVLTVSQRHGFAVVEHAMNVLTDAPSMQRVATDHHLQTLIRSPLAMGLLSGKYSLSTRISADDVRGTDQGWLQYFDNGIPNQVFIERFARIRELLETGGRSTVQGALCWLWAKNEDCIPIPGARTVRQVESLAQALEFGPLPESVMLEIESVIDRNHDVDLEDRPR